MGFDVEKIERQGENNFNFFYKVLVMVTNLVMDSNRFFKDVVEEAFIQCQLKADLYIRVYLVDILKHYLFIGNLYDRKDSSGRKTRKTLAENLLTVSKMKPKERFEKLKGLADSSLYISGFFSDSFQRKIIDIVLLLMWESWPTQLA